MTKVEFINKVDDLETDSKRIAFLRKVFYLTLSSAVNRFVRFKTGKQVWESLSTKERARVWHVRLKTLYK